MFTGLSAEIANQFAHAVTDQVNDLHQPNIPFGADPVREPLIASGDDVWFSPIFRGRRNHRFDVVRRMRPSARLTKQ